MARRGENSVLVSMRLSKRHRMQVVKRIKVSEKESVRLSIVKGVRKVIQRSNSRSLRKRSVKYPKAGNTSRNSSKSNTKMSSTNK